MPPLDRTAQQQPKQATSITAPAQDTAGIGYGFDAGSLPALAQCRGEMALASIKWESCVQAQQHPAWSVTGNAFWNSGG